jgi:hypothetical protein
VAYQSLVFLHVFSERFGKFGVLLDDSSWGLSFRSIRPPTTPPPFRSSSVHGFRAIRTLLHSGDSVIGVRRSGNLFYVTTRKPTTQDRPSSRSRISLNIRFTNPACNRCARTECGDEIRWRIHVENQYIAISESANNCKI